MAEFFIPLIHVPFAEYIPNDPKLVYSEFIKHGKYKPQIALAAITGLQHAIKMILNVQYDVCRECAVCVAMFPLMDPTSLAIFLTNKMAEYSKYGNKGFCSIEEEDPDDEVTKFFNDFNMP